MPAFTVTSNSVTDGSTLLPAQSLEGGNLSPQLGWSDFPADTKSFALTGFDPDAPTGSGWWYWVLFDIPAAVTELPAGGGSGTFPGLPAGAMQGRTTTGPRTSGTFRGHPLWTQLAARNGCEIARFKRLSFLVPGYTGAEA